MSFERLSKWDALAWVAGLALLVVTAIDWYSTTIGNEAREIQHEAQHAPAGPLGSQVPSTIAQQAKEVAQGQERNLWQVHGLIDRVMLVVLIAAALSAALAALMRVAEHRYRGSLTPSAAAAWLGAIGAVLVLYRIVQQPGDDQLTTLKSGPWLAFAALGLITIGASLAWLTERDDPAWEDEQATAPDRAARPGAA